jgi:prepilin-type N-terminal cleavage/methylation domain-containing protein
MNSSQKTEKGFTLIELTVVVLVLSLLAAIAYPAYASMLRRAQYGKVKHQLGVVGREVQYYSVENGDYPPDADPQVAPEGVTNWPSDAPLEGFYDYDHWSVGGGQCVVQVAFVDETLTRKYDIHAVNAQPGDIKEFDGNLVLGIDVYACEISGKGAIE